ncbi:DNA polymerase III subunit beta [Paenibacillus sp. FSL R7-0179]|uniref:DNA polymerase III subunit beta n=1 Tax=Paenibacillus sp. FSL R7-0179 TaxID=2921672 RepID=UPI0030FB6C26
MRVNVSKDILLKALQQVLRAVPANHVISILTGVHIQARMNELIVTASNSSMTIQYRIPQENTTLTLQSNGEVVVPAKYFCEIIRKSDSGMITLEVDSSLMLTISSEHTRIRLCGIDAADYPAIHPAENNAATKFVVTNHTLKASILQVAGAASSSEHRPVLTGVSFQYRNHRLQLTATNGIRLASRTIDVEHEAEMERHIIIPGRNLIEAVKIMDGEARTTEVEVTNRHVRFTANHIMVQSALIEGEYPSLHHVIPHTFISEITIRIDPLLKAVERTTVLASESIVRLETTADRLRLLSQTAEIGDIEDEVSILEKNGEDFTISLNGKYVADILHGTSSEFIRLRFTGKMSPIVIHPLNDLSSTFFLITPVRTAK